MAKTDEEIGRLLYAALIAEEGPDPGGDRRGLLGYAEADEGRTILDGGYDLAKVAARFRDALRDGGAE